MMTNGLLTLTYVKNEPKRSQKSGKFYTMTTLRFHELGDKWISGFGNEQTERWVVGDKVDVEIYEEDYQGKAYTKFRLPKKEWSGSGGGSPSLEPRIAALEARVTAIELLLPSKSTVSSLPF